MSTATNKTKHGTFGKILTLATIGACATCAAIDISVISDFDSGWRTLSASDGPGGRTYAYDDYALSIPAGKVVEVEFYWRYSLSSQTGNFVGSVGDAIISDGSGYSVKMFNLSAQTDYATGSRVRKYMTLASQHAQSYKLSVSFYVNAGEHSEIYYSPGGHMLTRLVQDSASASQQYRVRFIYGDSIAITFNPNGGNGTTATRRILSGSTINTFPAPPTREGYVFAGWFTAPEGGTQLYATTTLSANTTCYAHWKPATYTLSLHRNNSANDGATAGRSLTYGTSRALPSISTELKWAPRSGYTFLGWATAANETIAKYTDGQKIANLSTIQGETVHLYAVWKKSTAGTYTVRLHRNNSANDGATAGRTYTIGKARALPKAKTELKWAPRKGYDFLGWSTSANATAAKYTDGQSLKDLTKTAGATVHLYAVWKAHKYIVRLHRNNSKNDGATTGRAFDYDQVRFLPTMAELKWVRSGYMFLGWSQAQSSSTVKYADGLNVFNLSPNDGEELHVWGVWKKAEANAYLLRLHRNNSERDGATAGRQLKLGASRKLPTLKELGWTRTDATFMGWATTAKNAAAGKVTYKDGATVKNLVKTLGDTAHLYAVWEK